VHVYDLETGREVRHFEADDPDREEVTRPPWSPDGHWLLTASFDGKVGSGITKRGTAARVG